MIKTLLAAATLASATAGVAQAGTLADLRWDKRIVILFDAGAGADERIAEQKRRLLGNEAALAERELVAFAVVGDEIQPIYGEAPTGQSADSLRKRFDISAETPFTTILIGKDGGVKWRGEQPIAEAELEGIIDAMPMRRVGK